jgi:alpha-1,3-rhamnosyl/mannosyltransferase
VRVGYELTALDLDRTGSARAIERLREELARTDGIELVPLRHDGRGGRVFRGLGRELGWLPVGLPRRARALAVDLLHCPSPLAPPRAQVPVVVTVNDVMTFDRPEWFTKANVIQQRLVLRAVLRNAARVIVPSRFSADRVADVAGIPAERIAVIPYGVDARFSPGEPDAAALRRLGVERPYVLTVGALQPRKNIEGVLTAFERLTTPHRLVVAGGRGWGDEGLVRRAEALGPRAVLTGHVEDDELVALYRGADAFVFPSRYEGFGFPPLEAMACGTAVVASDRTSVPEVVGDAALTVSPDDPAAVAAALERVLGDPAERERLRANGLERAREFSWRRCAEATAAVYADVHAVERAR